MNDRPCPGRSSGTGRGPAAPAHPDARAPDPSLADPAPDASPADPRAPIGAPRERPLLGGRYRVVDRLGSPDDRHTFRAHDQLLDRDVVVKVLGAGDAADARQHAYVLEEARAAGRVVHPHVATVLDVIADDDHIYVIAELAEGRPLSALLAEHDRLGPAEAVEIAAQIADALAAAHQQRLVHGALSPSSIVVTRDGIARLVDLGTAQVRQATGELAGRDSADAVSTLAPEQLTGAPIDARTDVYALGALLYELLTGEPPFAGRSVAGRLEARLRAAPPEPSGRNPSVPPDLDEVVLTALAPNPDRRYQSAALLRDALRNVGQRSATDTQVMRRPARTGARRATGPQPATPVPPMPVPAEGARSRSHWTIAGRDWPGTTVMPDPAATSRAPLSRRLLWGIGLLALVALLALAVALYGPFGRSSSGEAAERWATFSRQSCEWSNVTTPPGICFGERPVGYRVRILEQKAARWMVWDPATQGPAYVDADALKPE